MEHKLGVSVYPDIHSIEEIDQYLKMVSKYGFKRVFSSMQTVGFDTKKGISKEELVHMFKQIGELCHKYHLEHTTDVTPMVFEFLEVEPTHLKYFKDMGIDVLRLDMSFDEKTDIDMINNSEGIKIEFNASIKHMAKIVENYITKGANPHHILACHNFYPQRYTGVELKKFKEYNQLWSDMNIPCAAFVTSQDKEATGIYDAKHGLPSVEDHRDMPINLQVRHLEACDGVSDFIVGNAFASEEEIKAMKEAIEFKEEPPEAKKFKSFLPQLGQKRAIIKFVPTKDITELEKAIVFDFYPHVDMGDGSDLIWRSRMERMIFIDKPIQPRKSEKEKFTRGDVLIVNNKDNRGHYSGEVQIVLKEIENDGARNYIGTIDNQELKILNELHEFDFLELRERKV